MDGGLAGGQADGDLCAATHKRGRSHSLRDVRQVRCLGDEGVLHYSSCVRGS